VIIGLQIVALIFSFSLIYFALTHYKKGILNKAEIISWIIIWTLVIFVVIFPQVLRTFATSIFITRLFDMMVVGGFILVIAMVSKIYVTTRKLEKKFEEFIRKEALEDVKPKGKK